MAEAKLPHLERVKAKAAWNYKRRLRDAQEADEFQKALNSGNLFPEVAAKQEEQKGKK
jgi:hypothetical protein